MLRCLTKKNSLNMKHASKISQVRMAHILCVLALLCFASCAAENTETEQGFKDRQLQQDSLSWLDKLQDKQVCPMIETRPQIPATITLQATDCPADSFSIYKESTKQQTLLDLLYKLFKTENGIILQGPKDTETREKNRRGLGGMTTRRFGCRVFFWKSLTAC